MKFDCDGWRDRRREKVRAKQRAEKEWHDCYALFAVRVARGDCRWLEVVQRRAEYDHWGERYWLYRAKETS